MPSDYSATATRLIAMKRPDVFICIDSKNEKKLAKAFGVSVRSINLQSYWDSIIMRIQDAKWYNTQAPTDKEENLVYSRRAAFLDALFYER